MDPELLEKAGSSTQRVKIDPDLLVEITSKRSVGKLIIASVLLIGCPCVLTNTLVDKIFMESELYRLMAYVYEANLASIRILEKIGFVREGVLRKHYLINGKRVNEVIFGLLRDELN